MMNAHKSKKEIMMFPEIFEVLQNQDNIWYRCSPRANSTNFKCGVCGKGNIDPRFYIQSHAPECKVCGAKVSDIKYVNYGGNRIRDLQVFRWL